eukprot:SAG31_NODE_471_length_15238_cov_14.684554_6_plen_628_part_00
MATAAGSSAQPPAAGLIAHGRSFLARELFDAITPRAVLESKRAYKVLILDTFSTKVLSACLKMSDLTEHGVSLVEKLEIAREPLPHMEAIYFVAPTEESIQRIIADFRKGGQKYAKAHLVFTGQLSKDLLVRVSQAKGLAQNIATLKDLNMEFIAKEDHVFSVDLPEAFHDLFSAFTGEQQMMEARSKIASRLATVCTTLGELSPNIRYQLSSAGGVATHATQVAKDLHNRLKHVQSKSAHSSERKAATVLVLDRTVDMVAPLLHELTYEAMIHDQLKEDTYVEETGTVKWTAKLEGGGVKRHEEILASYSDERWLKYRHRHIIDLWDEVPADLEKWRSSSAIAAGSATKNSKDTKEMIKIVKELPKFQKESIRVGMHVELVKRLQTILQREVNGALPYADMCELEMTMAFLSDVSRKRIKPADIDKEIQKMFRDPNISDEDKLRLMAIYQITQQDDIEFNPEDPTILAISKSIQRNLDLMIAPSKKRQANNRGDPYMDRPQRKIDGDFSPGGGSSMLIDKFSRFRPRLFWLAMDLLNGRLEETAYPSVAATKEFVSTKKVGWQGPGKKKTLPRLIIFMVRVLPLEVGLVRSCNNMFLWTVGTGWRSFIFGNSEYSRAGEDINRKTV